MDRKEFLQKSLHLCTGCGCMMMGSATLAVPKEEDKKDTPPQQGTPDSKKIEFAQLWVGRLMKLLDEQLEEKQKIRLMENMGKVCFLGAHGNTIPPNLDEFIANLQKWGGKECCRREVDTIYYQYIQNPEGLKVADGWCLCPLVEGGPPELSPTYCQCSVGYVREMFTQAAGKPVAVELTASSKRGDKACRFTIHLNPADRPNNKG